MLDFSLFCDIQNTYFTDKKVSFSMIVENQYDYVTKPFSPKELVLRVRNVLTRANAGAAQLVVRSGALVLDKNTLAAKLSGTSLDLTTAEFKLLAYLMERPGKVQDRYELQKVLFGYADTTQSRALDTHVKRLRQKLGEHAACIVTERGSGYYFTPEPQNTDR